MLDGVATWRIASGFASRRCCSGDNFAKAEGEVETMADGPGKFMAEREIAEAQDAMLSGKMSGCAMHLGQARQAESMSQAPYPGTMFSAPPAETTQETPLQPQGNWQPMKGANLALAEGPTA
jgi:hypothetical protein